MFIACECLNITVKPNVNFASDFIPTVIENDSFFTSDLCEVESLEVIEQLPKFILKRNAGVWTICHCSFCGSDVYASKDNFANDSVIAPKHRLIGAEQIAAKKKSAEFSPFFNVLIDHTGLNVSNINETNIETKLPSDVMVWLEEQANLAEERIQVFSDNEYAALENLKRRVLKDSEAIYRKSIGSNRKGSDHSLLETTIERREIDLSSFKIEIDAIKNDNTTVKNTKNRSFEPEELFFLDDVDIKETLADYPDDIITEDAEEVTEHISEYSLDSANSPISRSLPVPVPLFMKDRKAKDNNATPEGPCDIAASIEALTRSLHGDNIFGDLPPPRFSNTNL